MGIFSRRKQADPAATGEAEPAGSAPAPAAGAQPAQEPVAARPEQPARAAYERGAGPWDRAEVPDAGDRIDLGSLWVPGVPGMELRLEVDEAATQVVGVTAVLGESALQLSAFAAPRSAGVWDGIRQEIAAGITAQGGTAQDADGPVGVELHAQMPGRGPDGRPFFTPARFLGVDGPRWFLRGVLSGRSAVDPAAAEPLLEVFRSTVVVRGTEAMAPRDLLPMSMPEQAAPDPGPPGPGPAGEEEHGADGRRRAEDLRPFDRGPEITEVR